MYVGMHSRLLLDGIPCRSMVLDSQDIQKRNGDYTMISNRKILRLSRYLRDHDIMRMIEQ